MKKRSFCTFELYETEALAEYLERMARKGWMLEKFGKLLTFHRIRPADLKFNVTIMENASVFDSFQDDRLTEFRELCRDAGWEYAGTNGLMQIFYSRNPDAVPIHTDKELQFQILSRNVFGKLLPVYGLLLLITIIGMAVQIKGFDTADLASDLSLTVPLSFLLSAVISLCMLCSVFSWYRKNRKALREGGSLFAPGLKGILLRNRILYGVLIVYGICLFLLVLSGMTSETAMLRSLLPVTFIYYIIIAVGAALLIRLLHEKFKFPREKNRFIYISAAIAMSVLFTIILSFLTFRIIGRGPAYRQESSSGSLALTAEDLGYDRGNDIYYRDRKSIIAGNELYRESNWESGNPFLFEYEHFTSLFPFGIKMFLNEKADQLVRVGYPEPANPDWKDIKADRWYLHRNESDDHITYLYLHGNSVFYMNVPDVLSEEQLQMVYQRIFEGI